MAFPQRFSKATRRMIRDVMARYQHLTVKREYELVAEWRATGSQKAKDELLLSHMSLIVKMVQDMNGYNVSLDDLLDQAFEGAGWSMRDFDPSLGFRFNTFARAWIRNSLMFYVVNQLVVVRPPQTIAYKMLFFNLSKLRVELDLHGTVTERDAVRIRERLAEKSPQAAQFTLTSIVEAARYIDTVFLSADDRRNSDHGSDHTILNRLVCENAPVDEVFMDEEEESYRRQVLTEALGVLNPRQKDIFVQRKMAEPSVSLEVLGVQYGVSRERIRQIENQAMACMEARVRLLLAERADEAARRVKRQPRPGIHGCPTQRAGAVGSVAVGAGFSAR